MNKALDVRTMLYFGSDGAFDWKTSHYRLTDKEGKESYGHFQGSCIVYGFGSIAESRKAFFNWAESQRDIYDVV